MNRPLLGEVMDRLERKIQRPSLVLGAVLIAVCVPAFFVLPSGDDWVTSSPFSVFNNTLLLPGLFWRPFENMMRWGVGQQIGLHPALFHAVTVLGHIGSVVLLYRILRASSTPVAPALAGAIYFSISPGTSAAVWSVDSAVQTCSTAFGLASVWFLLTRPGLSGAAAAFLCASASVLWKESGIAWFISGPLFAAALTENASRLADFPIRKHLLRILAGACGAGLYFVIRAALATTSGIGAEAGRYAIHWNPVIWLKNGAMLLGVASSTMDTVSLFGGGSRAIAAASFLGGLPLIVWAFVRVICSFKCTGIWLGAAATGAVIAPHILLGNVSEMYAHPVIAALVLTVVGTSKSSRSFLSGAPWLLLALLTCVGVSAHKLSEMVHTGYGAAAVGQRIVERYGSPEALPERVCSLVSQSMVQRGYSVFTAAPGIASNGGRAVWAETGWRRPGEILTVQRLEQCPSDIEDIWQVGADGSVALLKRE